MGKPDKTMQPAPPLARLSVCVTCKRGPVAEDAPRPGAVLMAELAAMPTPPGVTVQPVECLSSCSRGCAVALSAPGKWSYVYADLDPAAHAEAVLHGAALYAASPDGIVPWRERPEVFRKQSVARVPPLEHPHVEP